MNQEFDSVCFKLLLLIKIARLLRLAQHIFNLEMPRLGHADKI